MMTEMDIFGGGGGYSHYIQGASNDYSGNDLTVACSDNGVSFTPKRVMLAVRYTYSAQNYIWVYVKDTDTGEDGCAVSTAPSNAWSTATPSRLSIGANSFTYSAQDAYAKSPVYYWAWG